MIKKSQHR